MGQGFAPLATTSSSSLAPLRISAIFSLTKMLKALGLRFCPLSFLFCRLEAGGASSNMEGGRFPVAAYSAMAMLMCLAQHWTSVAINWINCAVARLESAMFAMMSPCTNLEGPRDNAASQQLALKLCVLSIRSRSLSSKVLHRYGSPYYGSYSTPPSIP